MGVDNTISKLKAYFEKWHNNQGAHSNLVYPVGSIYISINDTNPATLFGGEWEQIEGRFLLGHSSDFPLKTGATNTTGGNKNAIIPYHTHIQKKHTHIQNSHTHIQNSHLHHAPNVGTNNDIDGRFLTTENYSNIAVNGTPRGAVGGSGDWHYVYDRSKIGDIYQRGNTLGATATNQTTTATNQDTTAENLPVGESTENANMPPYLVVCMWVRTK